MTVLTRWVLRHKILIAAAWLVITLVGFAFVQTATNSLSQQFSLPGQSAYETNLKIIKIYGNGGSNPPLVSVVRLPHGVTATSPSIRRQLGRIFGEAASRVRGARVVSYASTGNDAFISHDGRTTFGLIFLPPAIGFGSSPGLGAEQAIFGHSAIDGARFTVTGIEPLSTGGGNSGGPSVLVEALIGGLGALIVLVLVFRSFMALIPLLMAVIAIPTTFLVVWALTTVTQVSFIVEFLIALIGLGVAIDYSLLIVVRWREERLHGASNEEAVLAAMERAGLAVVFSGTTVAVGLLALVALPVPFLRSVGYAGMLIPLISVLVAITILPILLSTVGPAIDRPRPKVRPGKEVGHLWMAWGRLVVQHRILAAAVAIVILLVLLAPLTSITIGTSRADSLAKSGQAYQGLKALESSGMGAGPLTPFEILRDPSAPAFKPSSFPLGVRGIVSPTGPSWNRAGYRDLVAIPKADGSSPAGIHALDATKALFANRAGYHLAGYSAQNQAFVSSIYGNFPLMIALIVVVTFILLARAFRSVLLPLKAVIFILSRTREEYDRTSSTDQAITLGIGRTGRLVTSAALILFLAFISLGTAPLTDIKVLATGLAVGILLDATVIRSLLVPALVSLFGDWNWWLPSPLARILRVQPSRAITDQAKAA